MPVGKPTDPRSSELRSIPASACSSAAAAQQIVVTAKYTDGTHRRRHPLGAVSVERDRGRRGRRRRASRGSTAFRPGGHHGALPGAGRRLPGHGADRSHGAATKVEFPVENAIDAAVLKQWRALGISPSPLCGDDEFIRRAILDITGTLPRAEEVKSFVADDDPAKRAKLVDKLLARPEYAAFFAIKWADILRNKREGRPDVQSSTFNFHDWIRESLASNVPYDQFVRGILAASGSSETAPPVQWYRKLRETSAFVDDTAQVFLGMRLQCAKCHHHPFEKWSQHDYYGFAAFFARVGRKPDMKAQRSGRDAEVVYTLRSGTRLAPQDGRADGAQGTGCQRGAGRRGR